MGKKELLSVCVLLLLVVTSSSGIKVIVPPHGKRCIGQELDPEDNAVFSVNPLADEGHSGGGNVHVLITDPSGNVVVEDKVKQGDTREVSKDIKMQGVHQMCFKHRSKEPVSVVFSINFKSRNPVSSDIKSAIKDSTNKNIPSIERQLASAQVLLEDISNEIDYAQKQEDALKEVTDSTNARITWFSYLSMFVLLSSAIWQLFYLRNFFNSKKML